MKLFIAQAVGLGIGSSMLIYPVTYLIMKSIFKYKYKWTTFLFGFGIASFLAGFAINFIKMYSSGEIAFAGVLIPLIFSIIIIAIFSSNAKNIA